MGKAKAANPVEVGKDLIVIWWDGFNREHQAADGGGDDPVQFEFSLEDATSLCKKAIKKGALKAEIWRPGKEPEKIAAFMRTANGSSQQTHPSRR